MRMVPTVPFIFYMYGTELKHEIVCLSVQQLNMLSLPNEVCSYLLPAFDLVVPKKKRNETNSSALFHALDDVIILYLL